MTISAFVLQMNSVPDHKTNLKMIRTQLSEKKHEIKNSLVLLPECFAYFGGGEKGHFRIAESLNDPNAEIQNYLADLAAEFEIYLIAGTFPIKSEGDRRVLPMTLVFSPKGELVSKYQKLHLFDVDVGDATGSYRESSTWQPGEEIGYFDCEWGRIGLTICYDLRFPSLYQKLARLGCQAIVVPSAFTQTTGAAHWHVLLRARAIENQVYMIATNQTGVHNNDRETYGHSLIVDPWGDVLVDAKKELGLFGVELNKDKLDKIRAAMPVGKHNRFSVELKTQ